MVLVNSGCNSTSCRCDNGCQLWMEYRYEVCVTFSTLTRNMEILQPSITISVVLVGGLAVANHVAVAKHVHYLRLLSVLSFCH